jgi:hypothetical protein
MRIPPEAVIPREKLTKYLLVPREWDDKSKFLGQAGFTRSNPDKLEEAIRRLAADVEAVEDGANEYGLFFRIDGAIAGPNENTLRVALIWLQWATDGSFHFVTMKPVRHQK